MGRNGALPAARHKNFLMVVLVRTRRLGTNAFVQQDMLVELLQRLAGVNPYICIILFISGQFLKDISS
jgi:hypothetical protein